MKTITWRTLLSDAKPYRSTIATGQFVALLAVLVSLPVPLLFPLLIDEVLLQRPGWVTGGIDRLFAPDEPYLYIMVVLVTTLLLRVLYFLLNVTQARLFTLISKNLVFGIRKRILEHLKHVSVAEYEALGGGGVSARLVTDIDTVDAFVGVSIGRLVVSALMLSGVAAVLFYINWQLALIMLVVNPSVVALTAWLGRRIRKLKKRENERIEQFQNSLSETLDLFVQIRTHNQERHYIDGAVEKARQIRDASGSFGWKSEGAGQLSALVFLSGFELFRAVSMLMVLFSDLSIGEMFAVIGYLWFMVTPLQDLLQIVFSYQNATGALERLNRLLQLQQEPRYPHEVNPFEGKISNAITLDGVDFAYGGKQVLHDIRMQIPAGKTVALLGPSGSGKTTLAHIIMGLYPVVSGRIAVDGIPVEKIGLDVLREHVALVLQNPRMFNDTLRRNLSLGRSVGDAALYEALEVAQLGSVVSRLTEGLDTVIGKEGIRLSGGERQRLAVARMLVSDPNVVILDESTSALDIHTEQHLFGALRHTLREKTMLIIAHRLSTVEHADLIYVLKEGRIVESGSPAELLGSGGAYARFVRDQR